MALSRQEQRSIMRADRERRLAREREELLALMPSQAARAYAVDDAYVNPCLVRGIGVVTPPRDVRASARWHATATRAIGTCDGAPDGVASVRVTRTVDGATVTEIRPVSSFRRPRNSARRTSTAPQLAQPAEHHLTAADLAPIGDSNH